MQTVPSSAVPGKCCGEFHIFVSIYFVGLVSMCFGSHGIFLIFYAFIGLCVRVWSVLFSLHMEYYIRALCRWLICLFVFFILSFLVMKIAPFCNPHKCYFHIVLVSYSKIINLQKDLPVVQLNTIQWVGNVYYIITDIKIKKSSLQFRVCMWIECLVLKWNLSIFFRIPYFFM